MFKDECLETLTIVSDLKDDKYVRDQACQTKTLKTKEIYCQVIDRDHVETQTDFESVLPKKTRMKIDTSKNLSNFLLSVYPTISEQLLANIRSHAFDGYEVDWEENDDNSATTCVHALKLESVENQNITSVCWNSTGSVVAAALGSFEHETWCVHQSFVCLWNVDRQNIKTNKPDKIIDSDTCLMSINFHSKQPALLAGGDFSGKIYIWDMSQDDNPLVAFSGKDISSHQEPVTKVLWTSSPSTRSHHILSVGGDGRILQWEFNQLKQEIKLLKKFLIQSECIPRHMRQGISKGDVKFGITCLTMSRFDSDLIFIGTENGMVLSCSMSGKSSTSSESGFFSPSLQVFEGHVGAVNYIDSSPHFDNLFITCGSDLSVQLYNTFQAAPVLKLEPGNDKIQSVKWSQSRPTVIFVATKNLLIYDLLADNILPISLVKNDNKETFINSLACNLYQHNILASGDSQGFIKVWKLPNEYSVEKHGERRFFKSLLDVSG